MADNSSSQRVIYLDFLRVFATFSVIILHTAAQNWQEVDVHSFEWNCFNTWDSIVRWTIPVFVMISGALFLNPEREMSIKKLYGKNILRIITAFLFWSAVYTLRVWYSNPQVQRIDLFTTFMQGHYHMWFLFMIVGLYIITPAVRRITSDEKVMKYFLVISFIFTIAVSSIETLAGALLTIYPENHWSVINDAFTSDINAMSVTFPYGYVFYFVLGYYLSKHDFSKRDRKIIYMLGVAGFALTILLTDFISVKLGKPTGTFYDNNSLNVFLESVVIFVFFKYRKLPASGKTVQFITMLSNWSFGVYLIHALILEVLANRLSLTTLSFNGVVSVPIIAAIVFMLGTIASGVIHQIPLLKKYIV